MDGNIVAYRYYVYTVLTSVFRTGCSTLTSIECCHISYISFILPIQSMFGLIEQTY